MSRSNRLGASSRRLVFLCGVIPVIVTVLFAVSPSAILRRLDNAVYDILLRATPTKPPSGRVVIVDVDERSLSMVGQWPWRRDVIGELIARLRDAGAAVVAMDIVFPEPDRDGIAWDSALADRLREGRVVLGYAMMFDTPPAPNACELHPLGLAVVHHGEDTGDAPYFQATGAVCSLRILGRAAGASGFLNAAPDSDGILRRVPLIVELDGRVYASLALAAVSAVAGARETTLRISNVNTATLIIDGRRVVLDGKSDALLRYRGKKRTFPYVSAADVMSGRVPAGTLQDKIVFVGTTALGTREVVATPLDTLFAGVEVQATVADNLLQQDFIGRSQFGAALEALAVLVLGIGVALLISRTGILAGALGTCVIVVGVWYVAVWLISARGVFVSPVSPTIGAAAGLAIMTLAYFTVERKRADTAGRDRASAQRLMVQTLLSLTETRDAETGRHSRRTQQYARLLAEQLSTHADFRSYLTPERIELLSSLAPLHDIGKVGVPDHILNKPGALTPDELEEMRKHPTYGYEVILKAEQRVGVRDDAILAMAKDIVYTHHERWDGTGYPRGLRTTQIPIEGRLMAVVDVYDAVVTRTLYRPTMSHDEAVQFIVDRTATHFDPAVVQAFVSVASRFKNVSVELAG